LVDNFAFVLQNQFQISHTDNPKWQFTLFTASLEDKMQWIRDLRSIIQGSQRNSLTIHNPSKDEEKRPPTPTPQR
jgi:hypothetical protein